MEEMGRCSATGLRYAGLCGLAPIPGSFPRPGLEGGYKPRAQDSGLCLPDA